MSEENSKIYEMQINAIRNSFADYCQNCRDGIYDCSENVKFRDDSPGAIHLLLRYIDQIMINDNHPNPKGE